MAEPELEDAFLHVLGSKAPRATGGRFDTSRRQPAGAAIDCRNVSRRFGGFTAVDRVNLALASGEIFGLLGPNGAGKTTLIKMMCGLLEPSDGAITVGGVDVRRERQRVWSAIGYMSQRFSLYPDLSVRQNLHLYADLYGVDRSSYAALVTTLGLDEAMPRLARDLPGGVRQRLSLLCAILHRPPIVFLDEPTSGVDPLARRVFWELIYGLSREAGVTVVVSTHYMDEAAHCDRLGLMNAGRLIAVNSPDALENEAERRSGSLLAIRADDVERAFARIAAEWPSAARQGRTLIVRSLDPDSDRARLSLRLAGGAAGRVTIDRLPMSMDETFIDFIERGDAVRV
jgi:ABC-2 type transport system ATP-binding protein